MLCDGVGAGALLLFALLRGGVLWALLCLAFER